MKIKYNNFGKEKVSFNPKESTPSIIEILDSAKTDATSKEIIRKYCHDAIDAITYTTEQERIYKYYMHNIMRNLNNDSKVTSDDISVVIQYLALKKIEELVLRAHFEILPDYLYTLKFGLTSISTCHTSNDGSSTIYLRKSSLKSTLYNGYINEERMFDLLETIYHEIAHARQNHIVCHQCPDTIESKEVLLWLKEHIIDNLDPRYYYKNYRNLYIERDANTNGMAMALNTVERHFKYFKRSLIVSKEKKLFEYRYDTRHLYHYDPLTGYRVEGEAEQVIDNYIRHLANKYPKIIGDSLAIEYNCDGTKHNSKKLNLDYYERKDNLQSLYSQGTAIYETKLKDLRGLYYYLIDNAKLDELDACCMEHQAQKVYTSR